MRRLRGKFDGFSVGHHAIHRLVDFAKGLLFFVLLVLEAEALHQECLHLADGVASNDRDFQTQILEILDGSRLPFFMRFQGQCNIGILRRLRNRRRYLQIGNRPQQPVFADAVWINAHRLAGRRCLRRPFSVPVLWQFGDGCSRLPDDLVSIGLAQSDLRPRGPASQKCVND